MTVARVRQGLLHALADYPLLDLLRRRESIQSLRRRGALHGRQAEERLAALEAEERCALDALRAIIAGYPTLTQEQVARTLRVDRTMVNKVWNSGRPGRERQWTRSARIIAGTYRALEALGWQAA